MHNQQVIDFGEKPKSTYDNRKTGVTFICFEDQLMNSSSDLRFSMATSNWRNVQQALQLGDYGGHMDPQHILDRIQDIRYDIGLLALGDGGEIDTIIKNKYNFSNGTEVLNRLEKCAIAADVAGTQVRVMNGKFIGGL